MLRYPVRVTPDSNGTMLVDFRDVPEAHTFGDDREEALARASDALETALMGYIEDKRRIPKPSPSKRGDFVTLPALTEAKLALYSSMRAARLGKVEFAQRLDWHVSQIERLLDLRHSSRLDQIEAAFGALGKQISVQVSNPERKRVRRLSPDEKTRISAAMRRRWRGARQRHRQPA